jgi:phosphatidylglycerol---prolipoprotein diacylglyceryl transferase
MLLHPQFDPVAIHLGPAGIHWYGLMYLAAFALFLFLGRRRIRQGLAPLNTQQLDDLLFYGVLGVILGGRLGYVLFYKWSFYADHPLDILKVWEGGMSFHGGFLGVLLALALYCRKLDLPWLKLTDFVAPLVPTGLLTGRLGNFINGELWGRVTDAQAFWAMGFPQARAADQQLMLADPALWSVYQQWGALPRHPSQLYEMLLEGVLLFAVLWWVSRRPRPMGLLSGLFLLGYGLARFTVEFARQPDEHLGLLSLGLSMGQWLCVPMIVGGVLMCAWAVRRGQHG